MLKFVKKYRRDLHQIPELGYEEYKTKEYILSVLKGHGCEITELCTTGVCAYFAGQGTKGDGQSQEPLTTIAFRSDMDGLPVYENTGASYQSLHEGKMHACGHDGHMAMLLALAGEIQKNLHRLTHNVLLIFQPAEESPGGAQCICQSGILAKYQVERIFGFHLWPMIEAGVVASREKELMAMASEIDIEIKGVSAHCARAEEGIDALFIGCQMVSSLYDMVQNELPPETFRLLKFGAMTSGRVRNTIADQTVLQGSLRSFSQETFRFIMGRIKEIATGFENQYGCIITMKISEGYPPVLNDPALFASTFQQLAGFNLHVFEKPFMLAEDFSFYQQQVPGLFMFLGTGTGTPLHSSNFDFDEVILETGVKAYLRILGLC